MFANMKTKMKMMTASKSGGGGGGGRGVGQDFITRGFLVLVVWTVLARCQVTVSSSNRASTGDYIRQWNVSSPSAG